MLAYPEPLLSDELVRLRPWTDADIPAIVAICQDPAISRWSPVIPFPYHERDAAEWIASQPAALENGQALDLAIVSAGTGELLGAIALSNANQAQRLSHVGYWLAQEARGHGYMTAAVRLLARWAFEHAGFERLELTTHPENLASQRVAERCGFTREGLLRSNLLVRHSGARVDSVLYGLLPGELT